ncbi:MAG: hypothetical protein WAM14_19865 [Candidatus Nitrosopolaris sp.]
MVTRSQFIALLLIAGLLGIGAALTYAPHNVQAYAQDCTNPNPPPSCYNSGYIYHNMVSMI